MSNLATITNNILADSGIDDINVVVTTGSYTNPAWIVSLPWTKITGSPAFVTNVTASSPLFSSGGATPNITIQQSGSSASGFLSATDWNTFNNKANANGSNASGTWGINITGTAASETLATVTGRGSVTTSQVEINRQNSINVTTPGTTTGYGLHFGGQTTADLATGITFSSGSATPSNANAGIYVQGSGAYGSRMYLATTDSYATGSRTAITINESGIVTINRNYLQSNTDLRAPLFYDSNNTGYYIDPAGTSYLYDLTLGGAKHTYLYINPGNGYEAMVRYNGGSGSGWYAGKRTSAGINSTADFHFFSEAVANDVFGISTGGTAIASGDMRAPAFIDSQNTAFYLDPNATSTSLNIAGQINTTKSNGTLFSINGVDNIGYNATSGLGTYIKGTGNTYIYGGGIFFDGSTQRTIWHSGNAPRASNSNLMYYQGFTLDANTMDTNSTGFTYAVNAPYVGPIARFSAAGPYDMWINAPYGGAGFGFAFRTVNGDNGTINPWRYPAVYGVNANGGGDLYATIYYDQSNTGYYLDPAGTSNLYYIQMPHLGNGSPNIVVNNGGAENWGAIHVAGGGGEFRIGVSSAGRSVYSRASLSMHIGSAESFRVHSSGWDTLFEVTGSNGIGWFKGDARAPTFYDSNNTAYYIDGAATSSLNILNVGETYSSGWFRNNNANTGLYNQATTQHWSSQTNGYWDASSTIGVTAIRLWANGHIGTIRGYLYSDGSGFGLLNNQGGWSVLAYQGSSYGGELRGSWTATGDMRAPIFYDVDNTAYYINAASGSVLNWLTVNDWYYLSGSTGLYWSAYNRGIASPEYTGNSYGTVSTVGGRNGWSGYGIGSRHVLMSTTGDNIGIHDNSRGWLYYWNGGNHQFYFGFLAAEGSMRTPIFYDSNDTGYYLDPNSNSNLAALQVQTGVATNSFYATGAGGQITITAAIGSFGGYLRTSGHMVLDQTNTGYGVYVLDGNSVGVVKNAGAQSWSAFSDRTLKTIHSVMYNNLSKLESISPIYYSFNNFDDDKNRIGLIAQEVQEYFPELVEVDPRTQKLTLDYTGLIPVLLGAIKELKKEIDTLKTN